VRAELDPAFVSPGPTAVVLDAPIWGLRVSEFVDLAVARIRAGERTLFTTANAHSIVKAQGTARRSCALPRSGRMRTESAARARRLDGVGAGGRSEQEVVWRT
jgi:hypothetical protein